MEGKGGAEYEKSKYFRVNCGIGGFADWLFRAS
jgi:hypothetical protein